MKMKIKALAAATLTFCFSNLAYPIANCEDAGLLSGKLFSDICWNCMFPIRVSGVDINGSSSKIPDNAMSDAICFCNRGPFNLPTAGVPVGQWVPTYVVEQTRTPGCSLSLGGTDIGANGKTFGTVGSDTGSSNLGENQRHYHYYNFPLASIVGLMPASPCTGAGGISTIGTSELMDPAWYDEETAFLLNPDIDVVKSVTQQAACGLDSASVNAGRKPISSLYWCSGSWGSSLPMSSTVDSGLGIIQGSASQDVKVLASGHRKGIFKSTVGSSAACGARNAPILPKQQYRMSMFWPTAETSNNHWIGENEVRWGANRYKPVTGEDQVTIVWRWVDCCYTPY